MRDRAGACSRRSRRARVVGRRARALRVYAPAVDVPLLRLRDSVRAPTYATPGSVGFDLSTAEAADIAPGAIALVGTGLVFATPPGWCLLVSLRSSTPRKYGVLQPHAIGIVDEDYRGPEDELRLQLLNFTAAPVHIPAASRIAQGVFVRTERATWSAHGPEHASRGGFGSTGH